MTTCGWYDLKNIFAAVLIVLCGCTSAAEKEREATEALISTAKQVLERDLFDPSSAQYRDMRVTEPLPASISAKRQSVPAGVCGQINAKNQLGGFVGFRPFIWIPGEKEVGLPLHARSEAVYLPGYGIVDWVVYCADRPDRGNLDATTDQEVMLDAITAASPEVGEAGFARCSACHSIDKGGQDGVGPNLYGVVGRRIAASPTYPYSEALKDKDIRWSLSELDRFIRDPSRYAPGTTMTFVGVVDVQSRADLIVYLNSKSDNPIDLP